MGIEFEKASSRMHRHHGSGGCIAKPLLHMLFPALPGCLAELAEKRAVKAEIYTQPFGYAECDKPMRIRFKDVLMKLLGKEHSALCRAASLKSSAVPHIPKHSHHVENAPRVTTLQDNITFGLTIGICEAYRAPIDPCSAQQYIIY